MSSQHRDKPLNIRPPTEVRLAAQAALDQRDWDMTTYITACLNRLVADPDAALASLAEHRPDPKPRGRPRKGDDTTPSPMTRDAPREGDGDGEA